MQKLFVGLLTALLAVLLFVPMTRAQSNNTIVDIAANDGRFTTLVAAVEAAGLADALSSGTYTVFAPTDEAFAKLPAGTVESLLANPDQLRNILLYHAIPGKIASEQAKALTGNVTMANNQIAGLKVFQGNIFMNDDSKVIIPDIVASNGIIHVVDTVILPPWPRTGAPASTPSAPAGGLPGNIVDVAVNDGRFTTLVAAVEAAGLADALSTGTYTVFAPTDAAFAKLPAGTVEALLANPDMLRNILLYHAVPGNVSSEQAKAMTGNITMANNQIAGLKVFQGNLFVNDDSKVIIADVMASNGRIHVVDTVILPPWPRD
jgi:transforming growth factor-beta-induced protein